MNKIILTYFFLLFSLVITMPLIAQRTGSISGIVIHEKDNIPLAGAIVRIAGTEFRCKTDSAGVFLIQNIPPGTYSIYAVYIGYSIKWAENIDVSENSMLKINFILSYEGVSVSEGYPVMWKFQEPECSGRIITKEWIKNTGIR